MLVNKSRELDVPWYKCAMCCAVWMWNGLAGPGRIYDYFAGEPDGDAFSALSLAKGVNEGVAAAFCRVA